MRILPTVAFVFALMACAAAGFGQSVSNESGSSSEQREPTPADLAFEPIKRDINNLHQSLINKGGIAPEDHGIIKELRDRAAAFSREFPNDVRGPKAELILSKWLKDNEQAEAHIRRILQLEPDNQVVRMALARNMKAENRYADALEIITSHPPDPVQSPSDAWTYADCLFAEHQFEQASAVYDAIPEDSIESMQRQNLIDLKQAAKDYIALWQEEQDIRRSEEQADDLPRVMIVTSRGPILLELFENQAPNTVANFISLAEQGFYDTSKFHRVIANFMAQGGDPNSKPGATGIPGQGNPGYYIPDETGREDHRKHFTGSLAMAKTEAPNSGGCQFYITVTPTPHLNGKHTVFGRVIEGLDVVRSLKQDDEIQVVTVMRKRPHDYKPSTLPLTDATPAQPLKIDITPDSVPAIPVEPMTPPSEPETSPDAEPSAPPSEF